MVAFKCLGCGKKLIGRRIDQHFCSAVCTTTYHRKRGHPIIHADLPRDTDIQCVVCGDWFNINAYADRSGQRQPRFCSGKCRQKAYRQRKKATGS